MNNKKITIIGSGNVATHLARAFYQAGCQILQIWSREFDHAERLASEVMAEPTDKLSLLYPTADVYILAVSDDALFDLALDLKFRDSIVVHTSGSVPINVLRPISRHYGSLYAPQSFVRFVDMNYTTLPFCIEGSTEETTKQIEELGQLVSQHIYHIDSNQRKMIHLAAVIVNNFGNALNAMAQGMLNKQNIPFEILQPIIEVTAAKAKQGDLWKLQTGPAVRHDQKTIDEHRRMLVDNEKMLELYDLMTEIISNGTH